MNNLKTKAIAAALLMATTMSAGTASASDWLKVSGQINMDAKASSADAWEKKFRTQDAELKFELALKEGIKAVIKLELERQLAIDGGFHSDPIDVEKMVEEAYIQIETDKALGLPRAIVTLGKHSVAFGQQISKLPMFKDNMLYKIGQESEVIGMTVTLSPKFLEIVDEVAVSVFEAGEGDLQVSNKVGGSVKLTKKITDQIKTEVSALYKQSTTGGDDEVRGSPGVVWDSKDGNWTVWTEGLVFKHNPNYPDSELGLTAGISRKLGPGSVVVEYSVVQNFAQEIATAYNLPIGQNLVVSPELRYRFNKANGDSNEWIAGVRARVMFEASIAKKKLHTGPK